MEAQLGAPQGQYEVDPQDTTLRTGMESEDKQKHDEKPAVLKKVKEKVKKIKNKMGIKKNGDDGGRERESDSSSSEEEAAEEDDGYKQDDEPVITSAPVSEKRKFFEASEEPQRVLTGDSEKAEPEEPEKVRLGDSLGDVKEDPAAPLSTNPGDKGGEEIGISPVIQSFEAIKVSDNAKPESDEPNTELEVPKPETEPSNTVTSADQPNNVTYTEKIRSMATVPAEYGKNIASTVYDKISTAGTAVVQKIRGGPPKDGTGTETSNAINRDTSQDNKGVSVTEYVAEKLRPGEEDEALSDVISEAVQRNKEGMQSKAGEGVAAAQTRVGGIGVVEKIRGAVTSAVGGGGKGSDIPADAKSVTEEAEGIPEATETMKLD